MLFTMIHTSFKEARLLDNNLAYLKLRNTWIDKRLPLSEIDRRLSLYGITTTKHGESAIETVSNFSVGEVSETLKGKMDLPNVAIHIQILRQE